MAMEIEPGQAVHGEHHGRVRPEQWADAGRDRGQRRSLDGDDHRILRTEFGGIRAGPDRRVYLAIGGVHAQSVALHGRQMGTARHDRNLRAALEQAPGQMTADRAGAEDTDLHDRISAAARAKACTPRPIQASSG